MGTPFWSHPGHPTAPGPTGAGFPVWEISLQGYHLRSGDVSDSHQSESCSKRASSQLWQDSWPSLYFIFLFFSPPSFFLLLLSPVERN